jgi:hypothetical protein
MYDMFYKDYKIVHDFVVYWSLIFFYLISCIVGRIRVDPNILGIKEVFNHLVSFPAGSMFFVSSRFILLYHLSITLPRKKQQHNFK